MINSMHIEYLPKLTCWF